MLVEDFADFAAELARGVRLLEDGEAVAAKLVWESEIGAVTSGENDWDARRRLRDLRVNFGAAHFGQHNIEEKKIDF